jgi:hypothetical protein
MLRRGRIGAGLIVILVINAFAQFRNGGILPDPAPAREEHPGAGFQMARVKYRTFGGAIAGNPPGPGGRRALGGRLRGSLIAFFAAMAYFPLRLHDRVQRRRRALSLSFNRKTFCSVQNVCRRLLSVLQEVLF